MEMYSVKELTGLVTTALANVPFDRKPAGLYEPIRYVLSLGGKRIRPVLMLMAYNIYKEDVESIMPVALGVEFYHNFTLLHDDRSVPSHYRVCIRCGTTILPSSAETICWSWLTNWFRAVLLPTCRR